MYVCLNCLDKRGDQPGGLLRALDGDHVAAVEKMQRAVRDGLMETLTLPDGRHAVLLAADDERGRSDVGKAAAHVEGIAGEKAID